MFHEVCVFTLHPGVGIPVSKGLIISQKAENKAQSSMQRNQKRYFGLGQKLARIVLEEW